MKNIVVIAPHMDDETIGAGGYLLKHKRNGNRIFWINVTNAKKEYGYSEKEVNYWNLVLEKVKEKIGFEEVFDLAMEPAGLDKLEKSKLINEFRNIFELIQPNIVLVPYYGDAHSDHRNVFDAVMACSKSFRAPYVEKILCMEIISETDYAIADTGFCPNYFVDISEVIEDKLKLIQIYGTEFMQSPFPRNEEAIRGLAKYRGASCYAHYAEAFRMIKCVER